MIDAAIAGLGRWGQRLVDSMHAEGAGVRFVRAIDTDPRAGAYAQTQRLAFSSSLEDALRDASVRAVVLATPHSLHKQQVIAAANARKHVFCEKPLALTVADARAMLEACRRAGVKLAVGHNRRFWPSMRTLRDLLAAEHFGRLLHIEGHNSNENSNQVSAGWRTDEAESPGGGFTGAGLHVLDAFVHLFGPVRAVRCAQLTTYSKGPPPLDAMSALYEFQNGCSGFLATLRATPFYWRVHVFGSKGSAEVLGETELVVRMSGKDPVRLKLEPDDSVRAELNAFADAVEGGAPYPIGEDQMLATLEAFEATLRAMKQAP